MLSIERTKVLLGEPNMTDEEATEIRDEFRALAEIIFEQWQYERMKVKETTSWYAPDCLV